MCVAIDQNGIQKLPQVTTERRTNHWRDIAEMQDASTAIRVYKEKNTSQKKWKSTLNKWRGELAFLRVKGYFNDCFFMRKN